MAGKKGRLLVWAVVGVIVVLAATIPLARVIRSRTARPTARVPTIAPTTRLLESSRPISIAPPVPAAPPALSYMDVVRANVPGMPATQPLVVPLNLPQAAHLILTDPLYLDPRYKLWVTRPDAPPAATLLAQFDPGPPPLRGPGSAARDSAAAAAKPRPADEDEYVVPERVLFVHWAPSESNVLTPRLIVPRGAGYEIVTAAGRKPIGARRDYQWGRARSWDERIVVPTASGCSVFRFERDPGGGGAAAVEDYLDLGGPTVPAATRPAQTNPSTGPASAAAAAARPQPQVLFDGRGILAWLPWERHQPGGVGAARYADGRWTRLGAAQGWPDKVLHLVPLIGGSVLQLARTDDGKVRLGVSELPGEGGGAAAIDANAVEELVGKLADASPEAREKAFAELTKFGPAVRPILRKLSDDGLPPEAQARVKQLLKEQVQPLLGPLTLLGGKLEVVSRHADGGAVFYAEAGASFPGADGEPVDVVPAWLAVRPGRAVQLLPPGLVDELKPDAAQVVAVAGREDEWVVVSDAAGPRRYVGNGWATLLRPSESAFTDLVGVDRRGRWLFRRPGNADETLVLDPTLPDVVPRLPVWNYTTADEVGWDKDDWPAVRHGEALFALREDGWVGFEKGETLLTRADQMPTTAPTTQVVAASLPAGQSTRPATSRAATTNEVADGPLPLFAAKDGTRYFDGVEELRVAAPSGAEVAWPLPAIARGKPPAHLVRTDDGALYLFNQPGRVLRIKPTPGGSEPFKLDATFSRGIPSVDEPTRVWVDPAGRIVIAYEARLAILFPSGYIPLAIREKMLDPDEAEGAAGQK